MTVPRALKSRSNVTSGESVHRFWRLELLEDGRTVFGSCLRGGPPGVVPRYLEAPTQSRYLGAVVPSSREGG